MFSLYTSATIERAFVGVLRRSCLLPSDPVRSMVFRGSLAQGDNRSLRGWFLLARGSARSMVFRMSLLQCETGVPKMGSARQRRKETSFAEVNMMWEI